MYNQSIMRQVNEPIFNEDGDYEPPLPETPSDNTVSCEVCGGFAGELVNTGETHVGHVSFTAKMEMLLNHHLYDRPDRIPNHWISS